MNVLRFHTLWREALADARPTDSILGPWIGSWESDPSGHTGALRCVVRSVDDRRLDAAFYAVFWKVFWMTYAPELRCRPVENGYEIRGSWRLPGPFGGDFSYEGTITPTDFRARYRAAGDHGTFRMRRPEAASEH